MSGQVSSEISQRMLSGLDAGAFAGDFFFRLRVRGVALLVVVVVSVTQPASRAAVPQPTVLRKSRRLIRETL